MVVMEPFVPSTARSELIWTFKVVSTNSWETQIWTLSMKIFFFTTTVIHRIFIMIHEGPLSWASLTNQGLIESRLYEYFGRDIIWRRLVMMADLRDRRKILKMIWMKEASYDGGSPWPSLWVPGDEWPVVSCELNQSAEENQRMQSRN